MSKCNKVKFISPISFKVKSVFRKEEFDSWRSSLEWRWLPLAY